MCNALWRYCVIFSPRRTRSRVIMLYISASGTRSGINVLYFLCVECALVFYGKSILCCYILTL